MRSFRRKLENLLSLAPGRRIRLSFSGVDIVSSSFADVSKRAATG